MNLSITILTALTTGQAATNRFLSESTTLALGLVVMLNLTISQLEKVLILSILNTFFRPAQKYNENVDIVKSWTKLGTEFDEQVYLCTTFENIESKLSAITTLFNRVNEHKRSCNDNYLIDLIFLMARLCCIRKRISWYCSKSRVCSHKKESDEATYYSAAASAVSVATSRSCCKSWVRFLASFAVNPILTKHRMMTKEDATIPAIMMLYSLSMRA